MISFEDLGVSPELTEALAAEGIEAATPLQEDAIPVIAKGNNLLMEAGPGAGLLTAWLVPVLGRIEASTGSGPRALALCATADTAERLAESSARLATVTGHTVAALGSNWVLPERSDVLFATPATLLEAVERGTFNLDEVQVLVVDQAQLIQGLTGLGGVERVFDYLPAEAQRILTALPMSDAVRDLADRHFKRTVKLPSDLTDAPKRGRVRFRITPEPAEPATLDVVGSLLRDGARHVLVFTRSEDRAADIGDYLTLHGYLAGAPGDPEAPVWLGVDALEARAACQEVSELAVVSCDVPPDPDTLDRRHALADEGVVVVLPRELAHLKALGRRTGYETVPFPPAPRVSTALDEIRVTIERALEEEDIAPYLLALEPLFRAHDPSEVAAAAIALLRRGGAIERDTSVAAAKPAGPKIQKPPAWSKLFIGVGERDGLTKGDLLGAITGEADVAGDAVGRIDIKESHSLVEVHEPVARAVIQAINGTTIRGRSVRADFDRPRKGPPPRRGRAPR